MLSIPYSTSQDGLHDHDSNSDQPAQPKPSYPSIPTSFMHFYDIKPESLMHEILISSSSSATPPPLQFNLKHAHMDQSKVEVITTAAVITTTSDPQSLSSLASSSSSNLSLTPELAKEPSPPWKFFEHQNPAAIYGNSIPAHENSTPHDHHDQLHHASPTPSPDFHPVVETLRELELGKHILVMAVPMAVGIFSIYNVVNASLVMRLTAVAVSVGFVGIWNGLLMRRTCHGISNAIELLGIAFMLLAFFGIIACFLQDGNLIWIPFLCWVLSLVPFVLVFRFRGRNKEYWFAQVHVHCGEYVLMEDHPIFEIVEQQQLGRNVLVLAIPMAIALFSIYKFDSSNLIEIMPAMRLIALMLSVAVALISNGILLRIWKRVSNLVELLGIALMFGAFYMFGMLLLPGVLALIPAICFMLGLIPFVKAFFSQKEPETIGSNTDADSLPPV
ncbi:hypothetical protein GH714_039956 [Hevea brasiliensis]|uniref:Uncharacterized protein n=1 Tax=Hevea brasiliensis TaxID=3981 RepID=A0A6A6MKT8_HEVBR|nr:hypothetical protein GH714_039956 [Hevea brasiliensis]